MDIKVFRCDSLSWRLACMECITLPGNVYFMATHLKSVIAYAEYMELLESIWKD